MSGRFFNTKDLHIAATGTGSIFWNNTYTPYSSIAITKMTASMTSTTIELLASNQGDHRDNPLTGSVDSFYWAPLDEVTFTAFTASAAKATQIQNLGNLPPRYLQLRIYSVTGGVFRINISGKE